MTKVECYKQAELEKEAEPIGSFLRTRWGQGFDVAIVCGSGIGTALQQFELVDCVEYNHIRGFPHGRVEGHRRMLEWRKIEGVDVMIFNGRFHLYEGHALRSVVLPVVVAYQVGIRNLICTNAAGALSPQLRVGDILLTDEAWNFSHHTLRLSDSLQSISRVTNRWHMGVYDALRQEAPWISRGTYCSVSGPCYETRAEIAMFARFASAIGMSTVHELQCASALGMNMLAFSIITNQTAREGEQRVLHHSEVLAAASLASSRASAVITSAIINRPNSYAL